MHDLEKGLKVLYPNITDREFRLCDHSDGKGVILHHIHPKYGPMPTKEQLLQAALTYVAPSKLEGGDSEPTSEELSSNLLIGLKYLEDQIELWADEVAQQHRFKNINSIAKFLGDYSGKYKAKAQKLSTWIHKVYESAEVLEESVLQGTTTPPTWPELKALLPQPPQE